MKKVMALAFVVVALAACEKKAADQPAADSSAMMQRDTSAMMSHDSMQMGGDSMMKNDSMMPRDTTKQGM